MRRILPAAMVLGATLIVAVITYSAAQLAESALSEPESTPPAATQGADEAAGDSPDPGVDLGEPLKESIELPFGKYYYTVPVGSVVYQHYSESGVVDAETGEWVGTPIPHPIQWEIRRGESSVKIDATTGEMFEWNVAPEDEDDFDVLRQPRR